MCWAQLAAGITLSIHTMVLRPQLHSSGSQLESGLPWCPPAGCRLIWHSKHTAQCPPTLLYSSNPNHTMPNSGLQAAGTADS